MTVPIIDAHVHIFPPEVGQERIRFLERDAHFAALYRHPQSKLATSEDLLASMDEAGVDRSVALGFGWADQALCKLHNDYLGDVQRRFPDRVSVFAAIQPAAGEAAALEAERCSGMGFRGLGELMPHGQGYALDDERTMAPVVEAAVALGMPILTHASEPVGHSYPGKGEIGAKSIYKLVLRWPDLRVIAAHWGGGLPFYELMPEVAEAARNVWYDSAASPYLYRTDVFRIVAAIVGPEKILFGSDYPLLRQGSFLRKVRASGLTPPALEGVLGGNAARLLGMG